MHNFEKFLPPHFGVHEVANDFINIPLVRNARPLLELSELVSPDLLVLSPEEEGCHRHVLVPLVGLVQGPGQGSLLSRRPDMEDWLVIPLWHNKRIGKV